MKKLIFLFVLMWLSFNTAKGLDPSCLFNVTDNCGIYTTFGFEICDSLGFKMTTEIFIDTCGFRDINGLPFQPDSCFQHQLQFATQFKRIYSKEAYKFEFPYFPFDTTNFDMDTVTFFTINDIKQELNQIKDTLLSVSNITGEIRFYQTSIKYEHFSNINHNLSKFYASFENLVNVYETEEIINNFNIEDFNCEFVSYFVYPVESVYEKSENIKLFPNPASDAVFMDIKETLKHLKLLIRMVK